MKKVLVIAALVLTSTFGMLKAQTQKLGHINSMELMQMMEIIIPGGLCYQ